MTAPWKWSRNVHDLPEKKMRNLIRGDCRCFVDMTVGLMKAGRFARRYVVPGVGERPQRLFPKSIHFRPRTTEVAGPAARLVKVCSGKQVTRNSAFCLSSSFNTELCRALVRVSVGNLARVFRSASNRSLLRRPNIPPASPTATAHLIVLLPQGARETGGIFE